MDDSGHPRDRRVVSVDLRPPMMAPRPDLVADLRASTHLFYNRPQLLLEAAVEIERLRSFTPLPEGTTT